MSLLVDARAPAIRPAVDPGQARGRCAATVEITGGDDMKYSVTYDSGKAWRDAAHQARVERHAAEGRDGAQLRRAQAGAKQLDFVNAAAMARATDFIPADMKDQVLAATTLAGPGETVEVTFKVPAAPGTYPYMCTFPGHFAAGMRGTIVVK